MYEDFTHVEKSWNLRIGLTDPYMQARQLWISMLLLLWSIQKQKSLDTSRTTSLILCEIFSPYRDFNRGTAEIIGKYLNQDGGYRLEIPFIYRLYGPTRHTDRLKQEVQKLQESA